MIEKKILDILKKNFTTKSGLHEPYFLGKEIENLKRCILNNSVAAKGTDLIKFKKKLMSFTKSKHAILVNSGTSALHLSLIASDVKKNDEVLMPSLNYIASANTTLYCNAVPHFVEINKETLTIDVKKLDLYLKKILKKKGKFSFNLKSRRRVKALICLHIFGHAAKVDDIKKVCDKYNISLIEDAAEALGSFYKKKHLGTFGDVGVLSFNGNKIVTSAGGGAVLTNSKKIAGKISHLSKIGKIPNEYQYSYDTLGYNYQMPNLNSSLGLAQMGSINFFIKKKRLLFKRYKKAFSNLNTIEVLEEQKESKSNYWLQTIILKNGNIKVRNKILKKLNMNGYGARAVWQPLHKINYLKKFPRMDLKNTDDINKKIINLPSSAFL